MTTPTVQTLGPTDPNAPVAQKFYTVLTGILGLVGIAATFGLVTQDQAASVGGVATAATTLVGAVGTAVASFRTRKQLNNGTFDAAPPPVIVTQSPITDAFQNVTDLKTHLDSAVADSVAKVTDAIGVIQGAAAILPSGGLIGSAVVEAGSLVDQFLRGAKGEL